jgi:F-type H+-transporting ATPase subunit gamma
MIDFKSVGKDIEAVNSIKEFIVTNEQIAANNMQKIRDAVVGRRDFLAEITQFYNEVKKSYKSEIEAIKTKTKKTDVDLKEIDLASRNKNLTACILLSTNASLYGDIVRRSYELFAKSADQEKADIVIVGKMGKKFYEQDYPDRKFTYFQIPDRNIDAEALKPIILHIIRYGKVIVFHSKFESLIRQTPVAFVLSEAGSSEISNAVEIKYIFEPSLEKIVEYFEKEIFTSIFEQTIQESNLSKFASRMVTLDAASENIKKKLVQLNLKMRVIQHQKMNKDQINSITRVTMTRRRSSYGG